MRILITGVSRFLGLRLAKRLEGHPDAELVAGVDVDEPPIPIDGLEFVRADIRSPLILRVLESLDIDTIVHMNISSSPGRLGGRSSMKEHNVMGTLQLLGAAQRHQGLKKVIMKSSSAVYGYGPGMPSILGEDQAGRQTNLAGYAKDCGDAETYARDFGRRRRDVELVILRTQNVAGPSVQTSITDYMSLPVVPTALGFDPRIQLLHEEDAVEAFVAAMGNECRGIFNIAADGIVYLSQAIRLLGGVPLTLPSPTARVAAVVLRRFGVVDFPTDQLNLLLYGRVVDTRRAKEAFGFAPRHSTGATLDDFKASRDDETPEFERPAWERGILEQRERAERHV